MADDQPLQRFGFRMLLESTPDTEIVAAAGRSRILVLTTFDVDRYTPAALRTGASGLLLKDICPEELLAGIRAVAAGDAVIAPALTRWLLDAFADRLDDDLWGPCGRILALLAVAILAVRAATDPAPADPIRHARNAGTIALTTAEIRRLFNLLPIQPSHDISDCLHRSTWRHRHQANARQARYLQRLASNRR